MNNKIRKCIEDFITEIELPQYDGVINRYIVDWAVNAAYGDAKRTMKGIFKFSDKIEKALNDIAEAIVVYFSESNPCQSQGCFDEFHNQLCCLWTNNLDGTPLSTYGRAQKIANMSFKYLYCVDYYEKNYCDWFKFCHMTLDSYILDWMHQNNYISSLIKFSKETKWGKLDYKMYRELTGKAMLGIAYTDSFKDCTVLEAEFIIWDAAIIYRITSEYNKMLKKYKRRRYMKIKMASLAKNIDDYIVDIEK